MDYRLYIIFRVLDLFYSGNCVFSSVEESTLYKALLSNYDKNVLPRIHKDQTINITLNVILRSFQGFDERNGILKTGCLAMTQWNDNHLRWDPFFPRKRYCFINGQK